MGSIMSVANLFNADTHQTDSSFEPFPLVLTSELQQPHGAPGSSQARSTVLMTMNGLFFHHWHLADGIHV
jgi:hypothetical protein